MGQAMETTRMLTTPLRRLVESLTETPNLRLTWSLLKNEERHCIRRLRFLLASQQQQASTDMPTTVKFLCSTTR
jgi:hypothetical protein